MAAESQEKQTQFKPNFKRAKMNINSIITKDYRKKDDFAVRKNKPKTNPIKPNLVRRRRIANERKLICYRGL